MTAAGGKVSSADLVARLVVIDSRPWPEWKHGKPITQRQVAKLLTAFKVKSRTIRLDGGATPKGYLVADFDDAFARYLPSIRNNRHNDENAEENGKNRSATNGECGGYGRNRGIIQRNQQCGGCGGWEPHRPREWWSCGGRGALRRRSMTAPRSPEAVLFAARQHGVSLLPDGDKLRMKAPKAPPLALVEAVKVYKPELLRLLAAPDCPDWQTDDPHPAGTATPLRIPPDPPAGVARAEYWAAGVARLDPRRNPANFPAAHWQATVAAARTLCAEWGRPARGAELG